MELNVAMLFLGTSGPFGKFITLPIPLTIAVRAILALLLLLAYCRWRKINFSLQKKDILPIALAGLLMCFHWLAYFKALQLSNVAIGMLSLFTYPVITAFLEPLFLKTKFQRMHLVLALLVLTGIWFLAPKSDLGHSYNLAIGFGVFSAVCYALRNLILKIKVDRYQGSLLMGYQMVVVCIVLLPVYFLYDLGPMRFQWKGLVGVALITTALGHTMFINTFKHFSITAISIISGIQPVYGILIGVLFLSEIPSWSTLFGGALILISVVIESINAYRK